MYIFRMTVEVKHMTGTQLPEACSGAFVGVFLRAEDIIDAIKQAEQALYEDNYRPVRTYEAVEIDVVDLTEENETYEVEGDPTTDDLLAILEHGGVWYTAFNLYPPEPHEIQ